jgi:transcriptional regulator with XRE-family HTH domain
LVYYLSMTEVQRLIQELNAKGWTVASIARGVEVSKNTIHRWRSGQRHPENAFGVVLALQQLLDQPVPRRRYRRRQVER